MNGVSSTLKEEIKKSQNSKKKEKFKFIASIIITNIMVAILCLPSNEDTITPKLIIKNIHPNHQMMVIPLQPLVTNAHEKNSETPVSLISKDKKIISLKAYLHEEIKTIGEISQFKIEIANADIVKVSQSTESGIIAVPYVENKKISSIKKGSRYEISL